MLTISAFIIILSLLSMLYADNPLRTMRAVFAQVFGFAIIPAVAAISTKPKGLVAVDRVVMTIIIMSVVTSCLVAIGLGDARFADRAEGYFKHSNQLGIALSAGLGAFFGLYSIYLIRRKKSPIKIIVGTIAAPILLQVSLMALQSLNPRAYNLLALQLSGGEAHSVVSRQRLWSISMDLGLSHPFLGVGAGQPVGIIAPHSHNLFIDFFRTLGVPGLALVSMMVLLVMAYLVSAVLSTLLGNDRGD
ncbi:MAG: O-antigen ligase family protein, partial [Mesorhizobium sp.]